MPRYALQPAARQRSRERAPAPGNVLGSVDVPAAASFLMRLELEPGGRGVVGVIGANENCLRIIGRVSLEGIRDRLLVRGGVAAFQAADVPPVALAFGAFTWYATA